MNKYYYFPKVPLDLCRPANIDRFMLDPNWLKQTLDIRSDTMFMSVQKYGQLDPLIVTFNKREWVVEPGQGRWCALKYLRIEETFFLAKVKPQDVSYFNKLEKYEHIEIKTITEALLLFKHSNEKSHTGIGYLLRKGWLKDDR